MAKFVDEGRHRIIDILFGSQDVDSVLYLGLYTNTSEPGAGSDLSGITEPSGGGYSRIALNRGSWNIINDYAQYAQQTFTATADWGNVYGYFIATSSDNSGILLCVEHFSDGPYNVKNEEKVKITPKIKCIV